MSMFSKTRALVHTFFKSPRVARKILYKILLNLIKIVKFITNENILLCMGVKCGKLPQFHLLLHSFFCAHTIFKYINI